MKNITSSDKKFNMQMNIAKAIGISLIVSGHCTWDFLSGGLIPLGFYHVAIFFFIAGYFVKDKIFESVQNVVSAIKKILIKWVPRFYAYHWFYGFITYMLFIITSYKYGNLPNWFNLLIEPVYRIEFTIDAPIWFLSQLVISLIFFYIIMYFIKKYDKIIILCFFVILASIAIYFANDKDATRPYALCMFVKTLYSLFIMYTGYFYRHYLENKISDKLKLFLICCVANMIILIFCYDKIRLVFSNGLFSHNVSAYISPLVGIYMILFISEMLTPYVKEGSFVDKMGKNSFHIMINHFLVFYILQTLLYSINIKSFSYLQSDITIYQKGMYMVAKYKYFYAIVSLVVCTYFAEFQKYVYNKIVADIIPAVKNKVFKKA